MIDLKYRPEIDGLRAVAVILVLLFHADLGFTGGFIGVDVFFVISGFLITGIILKKQREGTFRLSEFWVRRIRRILPASIAMVALAILVGGLVLMPLGYEKFSKTAFFHQLMGANVYLWRHTGYFDGAAETKPLLHTWSLSVEEQFYLIYPFLLVFLGRFRESIRFGVLLGLFVLSLISSEQMVQTNQSTAYFLLPFRAWELLLGGLICFLPTPRSVPRILMSLLSLSSCVGILYCAWCYNELTRFPGVSAILPCAATAGFIYFNSSQLTWTGRCLSLRPVVFVGLISYSLYLAHWPILAFLHYVYGSELTVSTTLSALVLSVILAVLSWRFVERPFREGTVLKSRRSLLITATAAPAMILLVTFMIEEWEGVPQRLPARALQYYCFTNSDPWSVDVQPDEVDAGDIPVFGDPNGTTAIALWGDSHAMSMMPGIDRVCRKMKIKCYSLTYPGNPPLINYVPFYNFKSNAKIPERNQAIMRFLERENISLVIMTAWWSAYADRQPEQFRRAFQQTMEEMEQAGVAAVVIEDVATYEFSVPNRLARLAWKNESVEGIGVPLKDHYAKNKKCRQVFRESEFPHLRVYDPTPHFAGDTEMWPAHLDGVSMLKDEHHLSYEGAMRLLPLFEKSIVDSVPHVAAELDKTTY